MTPDTSPADVFRAPPQAGTAGPGLRLGVPVLDSHRELSVPAVWHSLPQTDHPATGQGADGSGEGSPPGRRFLDRAAGSAR